MPPEVMLYREALCAVRARVRGLSRVDALVIDDVRPKGEAFPTRGAGKGLLLGVCPLVTQEVSSLCEAPPTIPALEGLLSSVGPPMFLQLAPESEDLPTGLTLVLHPS